MDGLIGNDGAANLMITKRNIVKVARLVRVPFLTLRSIVVKAILDFSTERPLDEHCDDVKNLITVLEHVFYHGLRISKLRKFPHPWRYITNVGCDYLDCIKSVGLLKYLKDDYSKLRAWIKIALVRHCTHHALSLIQKTAAGAIDQLYHRDALLRSPDFDVIVSATCNLVTLDFRYLLFSITHPFSLDLKFTDLEFDGLRPIDYNSYLHFIPYPSPPKESLSYCRAGSETTDCSCGWRVQFVELQDAYESLTKKQHQLELQSDAKDTLLKRCAVESAKQKCYCQELESQILELQVQVALFHEQCARQLRAAGLTPSRLRPPTLKQWTEIGRRRRYLVSQARAAVNKTDPYVVEWAYPSIFAVDQGVDAMEYQSTEDNSTEYHRSADRRGPPSSLCFAPIYRMGLEVGEEPRMECEPSVTTSLHSDSPKCISQSGRRNTQPTYGSYDLSGSLENLSGRIGKQRFSDSCRYTLSRKPMAAVRLGLQQMPEASEHFILPDFSGPHSMFSSFLSSGEARECADKVHVTREKVTQQPVTPNSGSFDKSRVSNHRPHPEDTTVGSRVASPLRSLLNDKAVPNSSSAVKNTSVSNLSEQAPETADPIDFETSIAGLLDSLSSSELLEPSSEYGSRNIVHSTKEYYQLTSQSEEDFDSSPETGHLDLPSGFSIVQSSSQTMDPINQETHQTVADSGISTTVGSENPVSADPRKSSAF
ncbi:uncharacterized protein DEA37_0000431 [Paragonimus westermani]|uniref:RUN domain-containing protein n=1 Tax=Paragonimus westermani TaxID=34504 RepID=A0A5J4NF25_9TREM|nr:uncharacterized protein DEA37_0000431 [Paragonimus westermani]